MRVYNRKLTEVINAYSSAYGHESLLIEANAKRTNLDNLVRELALKLDEKDGDENI